MIYIKISFKFFQVWDLSGKHNLFKSYLSLYDVMIILR